MRRGIRLLRSHYDSEDCEAPGPGEECTYDSFGFEYSGIVDCTGTCGSSYWYADGTYCDDQFDCEELGYDGGDCLESGDACTLEDGSDGVYDCDLTCAADASADGECDEGFNCEAFDYDGGMCEPPAECVDTDDGASDAYGDTCAEYVAYPSWCGGYDDDDFDSLTMCCACGGGTTGG